MALDLVGVAEIADRLGVRRQTVAQWKIRGLLPVTVADLACGPVWEWKVIETWAKATGRL